MFDVQYHSCQNNCLNCVSFFAKHKKCVRNFFDNKIALKYVFLLFQEPTIFWENVPLAKMIDDKYQSYLKNV